MLSVSFLNSCGNHSIFEIPFIQPQRCDCQPGFMGFGTQCGLLIIIADAFIQ
jgi:hypothetical protein